MLFQYYRHESFIELKYICTPFKMIFTTQVLKFNFFFTYFAKNRLLISVYSKIVTVSSCRRTKTLRRFHSVRVLLFIEFSLKCLGNFFRFADVSVCRYSNQCQTLRTTSTDEIDFHTANFARSTVIGTQNRGINNFF